MDVAPSGRPEQRAAAEISAEDNSDPMSASRPGLDDNPRPPVPGVTGGEDDPPAEPDDDEYVPL
jgi:hypothetical protein